LHAILDDFARSDQESIVSWQPHGKGFKIYKAKEFAETVMSKYFNHTKYNSFRRQLQLYGFRWIKDRTSADHGAYCHPLFQRGKSDLCIEMTRQKIKGVRKRKKKTKIQRQTKGSKVVTELQPTSFTDINARREKESSIRRVSLDEDVMKHTIPHSLECKIPEEKNIPSRAVSLDEDAMKHAISGSPECKKPEEKNILSRAEGRNQALVESNKTMKCLDNKQFRKLHDDCAQEAISNIHLQNILSPLVQNEAVPMNVDFATFLAGRVAEKIDPTSNSFQLKQSSNADEFQVGDESFFEGRRFFSVELRGIDY
jgi:hypothetical protein